MNFKNAHITSAAQFSREDIESLFARADDFSARVARDEQLRMLAGKTLATLFYGPSARARGSFENAMQRLGGSIHPTENSQNPAGFVDAVRSIAADAIVLRHPDAGAAATAAAASLAPIINAGDGAGEHPTQALADLYTLRAEKKQIAGLRVAMLGDLKNGRAAHSLALLLAQFDVYVSLVAPAAMSLPYDTSDAMRTRGITVEETNDLRVIEKADAVILCRVDRKYFPDAAQYAKMSRFYRGEDIAAIKRDGTWLGGTWDNGYSILAKAYQKTSAHALLIRMALLSEILG